ncbi:MAG: SUMF1/EgtB/PvdO family nonheme iron enzyme [Polyangiaceae bacterium]
MSVLQRVVVPIVLGAFGVCLSSCGQAQHPHSTLAPGDLALEEQAQTESLGAVASSARKASGSATVLASVTMPTPGAVSANDCAAGMVRVADYCIDRYEAYVVELDANGKESEHSPYTPVDGLRVRAKVAAGVVPQGYISQVQALQACQNAGKRLCTAPEFSLACRGPGSSATYPYGGTQYRRGKCNEGKGSAVPMIFGQQAVYGAQFMNDPRLNRWAGGLAKTGAYAQSVSPFGVYDLVGNLHEWGAEVAPNGHGDFRGGYYGDAEINGRGCDYVTTAHAAVYHDYSTGFRCCADAASE